MQCDDTTHRYAYPWGDVAVQGMTLMIEVGDDEPWTCCFANLVRDRMA